MCFIIIIIIIIILVKGFMCFGPEMGKATGKKKLQTGVEKATKQNKTTSIWVVCYLFRIDFYKL
ncbi:hypothetical protein Hanom_Chr16g01436861 [Helianthus anomalus]